MTEIDFFISYTTRDKDWAEWIAWQLEHAGHSVVLQDWDVRPGDNFIQKMHEWLQRARRILVVLSANYLAPDRKYPILEWTNALDRLVPVRIDDFVPPGLLQSMHRIELHGLSEADASKALLKGIETTRGKPDEKPIYPAHHPQPFRQGPKPFPGDRRSPLEAYLDMVLGLPRFSDASTFGDPGAYRIEPSDMQSVVFREAKLTVSGAIKAMVGKKSSISLETLYTQLCEKEFGATVLLGEAGVGKTVTCRRLCRMLAADSDFRSIPVYVPLGEWIGERHLLDFIDSKTAQLGWEGIVTLADEYKVIAFLDGLNEIPPDKYNETIAFVRRSIERKNVTIVSTTRPVAIIKADALIRSNISFYEIHRWTDLQLGEFLVKNDLPEVWDELSKADERVRSIFRLPLMGGWLIRQWSGISFRSIESGSDVFNYMFEKSFEHRENRGQQLFSGPEWDRAKWDSERIRSLLKTLAYEMTRRRAVRMSCLAVEQLLPTEERHHLLPILKDLVNMGMLRCFGGIAGIDRDAQRDELLGLDISFPHQAFQEYMTAGYAATDPEALPPNPSTDAFWREIPVYMIKVLKNTDEQRAFVQRFIEKGDFLTAVRLSKEISDHAVSDDAIETLVSLHLDNFATDNFYSHTIESFEYLGEQGRDALIETLEDPRSRRVYAKAEAAQLDRPQSGANEELWRKVGRAVYILGELNEMCLAQYVADNAQQILSLHLRYHLGEALLCLARGERSDTEKGDVGRACHALASVPCNDEVVVGYAYCALKEVSGMELSDGHAEKLNRFLEKQIETAGTEFNNGFWRRAHGIEIFAELADFEAFLALAKKLFKTEDRAEYADYETQGYNLVHSSILKAVNRICDRRPERNAKIRQLLESMFRSKRASANTWLRRIMEQVLLKHFASRDDAAWLQSWIGPTLDKNGMGGVLRNVLYLSGYLRNGEMI